MLQLTPAQLTPALRALFAPAEMPGGLRCTAILEGIAAGKILTDDLANPTWGVIQETIYGTVYLGGSFTTAQLSHLIETLRRDNDVLIGLWPDDELIHLLPPNPQYEGAVSDFTDRPIGEELDAYLTMPDGCQMRRVDDKLFLRSAEYHDHVAGFDSPEKALEKLIGFYLMRGDDILSEAFAGAAIQGIREVGVVTHELHRGKGYATIACAHLIQACEAAGNPTYWNCNNNNVASMKLARKLGYRKEKDYKLVAWFKSE